MTVSLYFGFAVLFVLGVAVTGFIAIRSQSPLRWTVPFTVALSVAVGYFGLDLFLGSAKPVGAAPGWQDPYFGEEGAIVLGGKIAPGQGTFLLLQEDNADAPKLYLFPDDPDMQKNLKQAMDQNQRENQGQPWGFRMKPDGQKGGKGKGQGRGKGEAKPGEESSDEGGMNGDKSLEDRPGYKFGPAQPKQGTDKPYRDHNGYREFRAPERRA